MKNQLFGLAAGAILAGLVCAAAAAQQDQTIITVTVTANGQAAPGVEIVLELANKNKVATAVTAGDGTATLNAMNALEIANLGKVELEVVEEQQCPDGRTYITVTQRDQPPDDKGCKKRRRLLVFLLFPGEHVALQIDTALETAVVTSTTGGPAAVTPPAPAPVTPAPAAPSTAAKLITFQIGGNVGVKIFSGINNCASFIAVFPGATCSNGNKAFAGGADGAVILARYVGLIASVYGTNYISRTGSSPTGGGENSKAASTFEQVGGAFFLPLGRVTLSFDVAAAFQEIRQKELQSVGSGTSATTTTTHPHVDTVGPSGGAKIQVLITNHFGLQGGYQYITGTHSPGVNEHNNVATGGIYFTF